MSDKPVTMQDGVGRVELPNDPAKLKRIIEIERECSVKRNLCPDHRDKQAFQPCVVCRAEHAEKMRDLTLQENSRLKDALDREREARQGIETLYREMCLRLRATCERYKLGLGGEQLDVLVSEALDKARADAARLRTALERCFEALNLFAPGVKDWGTWLAHVTNGAANRADGVAAAKEIVRRRCVADDALRAARKALEAR